MEKRGRTEHAEGIRHPNAEKARHGELGTVGRTDVIHTCTGGNSGKRGLTGGNSTRFR